MARSGKSERCCGFGAVGATDGVSTPRDFYRGRGRLFLGDGCIIGLNLAKLVHWLHGEGASEQIVGVSGFGRAGFLGPLTSSRTQGGNGRYPQRLLTAA